MSDRIRDLASALPARLWPPAFAASIAAASGTQRRLEFDSAASLLRSIFAVNHDLDWRTHGLVMREVPVPVAVPSEPFRLEWHADEPADNWVALPAYAIRRARPSPITPAEARAVFGLPSEGGAAKRMMFLRTLISAVEAYAASQAKESARVASFRNGAPKEALTVRVGVIPYHDSLFIPALLFLVSDLLQNVCLRFEFRHWQEILRESDVPLVAGRNGEFPLPVHIGYASEDHVAADSKFEAQKRGATDVVALRGRGASPGQEYLAINFQGYYAASDQLKGVRINGVKYFDTDPAEVWDEPYESEHLLIAALASGCLPPHVVIVPSLQGFIWASEAGLIAARSGEKSLGALDVLRVDRDAPKLRGNLQRFGFFVRYPLNDARDAADELTRALQQAAKAFFDRFLPGAMPTAGLVPWPANAAPSDDEFCAGLLAPLYAAKKDYDGVLMLLGSRILRNVLASEYERETKHCPEWLATLREAAEAGATESQNI